MTCFIYDPIGNEKEDVIYYKNADGCLIVYDISDKKSFEEVKNNYIPLIKKNCKKDIEIILLGNKSDLDYLRQVSIEEGTNLAFENKFRFKETSCVDNKNVSDAFQTIIEMTNFQMRKIEKKKDKCSIF